MLDLSPSALAVAVLWTLVCIIAAVVIVRDGVARRKAAGSSGFPALLINGVLLLGLAPAVSVLHFVASKHQSFWGGAGVLLTGLLLIASHFALNRRRNGAAPNPAVLTFREKSIAAQFAAILLVYGYYGVRLWGRPLTPMAAIAALIGITVLMILFSIASHLVINSYARPERPDERDVVVELRGSRNAYRALAAGVWFVLLLAIAHAPYGPLFCAIMGTFALAELVRLGSQLVYYRLGA